MKRNIPAVRDAKREVDLTNTPEVELLHMAAEIFTAPGPLTDQQQKDLAAIDKEFTRRDSLLITA